MRRYSRRSTEAKAEASVSAAVCAKAGTFRLCCGRWARSGGFQVIAHAVLVWNILGRGGFCHQEVARWNPRVLGYWGYFVANAG